MLHRARTLAPLLATLALGCAGGSAGGGPKLAPARVAGPPKTVLAYGGTSAGLNAHLTDAGAVYTAVTGQRMPLRSAALGAIQQVLGLGGTDGLDLDRPIRFAWLDDALYGNTPVLVAFGANRASLEPNLPNPRKTETGIGFTLPSGAEAHLAFAGPTAVMSFCGQECLTRHLGFMTQLMARPTPGGVSLVLEMDHLAALHGEDMKAGLMAAKKEMLAELGMLPTVNPKQAESFAELYDFMVTAVDEADSARMTVGFDSDGVKLDMDIAFLPSSPTGRLLAPVEPGPWTVAEDLPASSVGWVLGGLDRDASADLITAITPWMSGFAGLPDALGKRLMEDLLGDQFAMTVSPLPGDQVAAVVMNEFGTATRAGAAFAAMLEMYQDASYAQSLARSGMAAQIAPGAYQLDGSPVAEIQLQSTLDPSDPESKFLDVILQWMGQVQTVQAGSRIVFAYGPERQAILARAARGQLPGGLATSPTLTAVRSQAAPAALMVAYVDAVGVARLLPQARQEPLASILRDIGESAALHYSLGVPDGRLHLNVYVSNRFSRAVFMGAQLASQTMGGMQ